jgi:hypothetical protein
MRTLIFSLGQDRSFDQPQESQWIVGFTDWNPIRIMLHFIQKYLHALANLMRHDSPMSGQDLLKDWGFIRTGLKVEEVC